MGLENLKSVFQEELNNSIEKFSSNVITDVNGTNFFNKPPQPTIHIATNPTDFSTAVGNNELPFTPLSQLGQSALDGMSWESLYNSNHSPKDNPSHKGLVPINYPNVSRDNLNIRNPEDGRFGFGGSLRTSAISAVGKLLGTVPFLGGDVTEFLKDTGKEPYIVSSIGKGGRRINSNFLGRGIPLERSITDTVRIAKFLTSPAGLLFIGKQEILSRQNQKYKSEYKPLSTLISTFGRAGGGPVGLLDRTQPDLSLKSVVNLITGGDVGDVDAYPEQDLKNLNNTFNYEDTKINSTSKGIKGDIHTLLNFGTTDEELTERLGRTQYKETIEEAHSNASSQNFIEGIENGMPFYFKDMRDGAYVFFRAYIEGLSENISPNYNPTQYIGRSEPVYTYGQTERDINFTLKLFAQTKDELGMIYKKMDRLTSMCYPEYYKDTFSTGETDENNQPIMKSYGNRMKPPLTKLRIGELYGRTDNELMGYIKSLSYSVDQASPYEIEVGKRVPMFIVATIGYQVIHSTVPNLETKFYGINYNENTLTNQ